MKIRKRIFLYGALISLAVALEGGLMYFYMHRTPAMQQARAEQVVVNVWTKDRHDLDFWRKKVDEFNEKNDQNITVDYQCFSDNYTQAVENALDTSGAPDMVAFSQQLLNTDIDYFENIEPWMDDKFRETFADALMENVNVVNGKCYYVPTSATVSRLFYNKTIFKRAGIAEPPSTMEELLEDAGQITKQLSGEGIYGFAANFKNAESALNRSLMKQGNIQYGLKGGYDFAAGSYNFTAYEGLITEWRTLMSPQYSYPGCEELDIDPLRKLFAEGKIGMYMSYSHAEHGVYTNQLTMKDDWDCTQLPTQQGIRLGAQNYNLNNGFLFKKDNEHMEQAWYVYTHIFADIENLREYCGQGLGVSILDNITEKADQSPLVEAHPDIRISSDEKLWPNTPLERYAGAISVDGPNYNNYIKNLIFGVGDIHEELKKLTDQYNNAYEQAILAGTARRVQYTDFQPLNPVITDPEEVKN